MNRNRILSRSFNLLALAVCLSLYGATVRAAGAGGLDYGFNASEVRANVVRAVAVQPDGKILIGGDFTFFGTTPRNRLARLNSDGTLDTTFPASGSGVNGTVLAVKLQTDGKILIGGSFNFVNGKPRSNIARLNSDGTLDTAFLSTDLGADFSVGAIAVQTDGKVVIVGSFFHVNGMARGGVARLNSDGTLDTGFLNSGSGADSIVNAVAVQTDGKILIGGLFTNYNGTTRSFLARLNSDGSLDTAFLNSGNGTNNTVFAIAVQPGDNKILIGGSFTSATGTARSRIARLNSDGTLDTSFPSASTVTSSTVRAIVLQTDGKIIIGGQFQTVSGVPRSRIARLNSDGSLDTTFLNTSTGANNTVFAVALQADGKVLIGGQFLTVNNTARNSIARLGGSDGSLDASFVNSNSGTSSLILAEAVQPDGKILFAGLFTSANGTPRNNVARLNSDGSLDAGFLNNLGDGPNGTVYAIAVQPDGKILVGGFFSGVGPNSSPTIARLNSDGSFDSSFVADTDGEVLAIAVQPDGKILIGGFFTFIGPTARQSIARLNSDGSLDTSFINTGIGADNFADVFAIAVQTDGQILVGGDFLSFNGTPRNGIARLNSDGSLDTTFMNFPNNGISGTVSPSVNALALLAGGKIIISGSFANVNGTPRNNIARLNSDGSLDTTFLNSGSGADGAVFSLSLRPDGKVLIGGTFYNVNGAPRNNVARLNSDGTLDTAFLKSGSGANSAVNAIVVQASGKVVIGGSFATFNDVLRLGIARLFGTAPAVGDFDGDGRADPAVWNPNTGNWSIQQSSTNTIRTQPDWGKGSFNDVLVAADYDGDGKTDIAVWRPSEGNWYIIQSTTNTPTLKNWGTSSDIPVPGDYDGDGRTDIAVFRPSEGNWYIVNSMTGAVTLRNWGNASDKLVPGDYDGDGRTDLAVFRPSEGNWYAILSRTNTVGVLGWGTGGDKPVPADYDGDGQTDVAVFRPSEGNWYIIRSTDGVTLRNWGNASDKPLPADYDGDGKADISIFRASESNWYIIQSATNSVRVQILGTGAETPVPPMYLPQ